jgi:competence protein ComEC
LSGDVVPQLGSLSGQLLNEPQASLLSGMLFGSQVKLPSDFTQALRVTGTLHVVAVSGQNMSILAGFLGRVFAPLGAKLSLLLKALGIIGYIFLVGGGASVIRSGLMAMIALLAMATGRQGDSARALIVVALGMVVLHSDYLSDIGWQLSVLATAGIIFLEPLIAERLKLLPEFFSLPLAVSLAAELFTWPVIVYNFGIFSVVGVPTNILVEWSVPFIMMLGAITLVGAWVWLPLGQILAWVVWVPLSYFVAVVEGMARLPFSSVAWKGFPLGLAVFYYSVLFALIFLWSRKPRLSS